MDRGPSLVLSCLMACLVLMLGSDAAAGGRAGVRNDVYSDEQIIVVSPATHAAVSIGDQVEIEASVALDVLSGATPVLTTDAVTSATYFEEVRRGASGRIRYQPSSIWEVHAGVAGSVESDHETVVPTAGFSTELFQRMSKLDLDYAFLHERVGLSYDAAYDQRTLGHSVDLRWSQVLGRRTNLLLIGTLQWTDCEARLGCQANPYRRVPIVDAAGWVLTTVGERHPGRRIRGAGSARLSQYLGREFALHAGYRYYGDDWRMTGHTGDLSFAKTLLGERLRLRLEGRFTWQGAASFYRDDYRSDGAVPSMLPEYRSADREMARMFNILAGGRAEYAIVTRRGASVGFNARVARIWYRYLNYRALAERNAWVIGGGLTLQY